MVDGELPQETDHALSSGNAEFIIRFSERDLRGGAPGLNWVRFALRCRDSGLFAAAEAILASVLRYAPCSAAYYELAFLHRLRGEHHEAIGLLRKAGGPDDKRVQTFLAHMLHAVGAHSEADVVLDRMDRVETNDRAESNSIIAFGRYLSCYPLESALGMLDQLKSKYGWLDTDALADNLAASVRDRRPFAMVRLGDGEGGMLRAGQQDEYLYHSLYERNRQEFIAMWFGDAFDWRANGFADLAAGLLDELKTFDVVGIPYDSWIRHEYAISSLRGIPSLVNVYRALLAQPGPSSSSVCSQQAHLDLHISGQLMPILVAARRISVITCLREVGELLQDRLGLEEVVVFQIPGEQGSIKMLGPDAVDGTHYPAAFNQLQAALSRPHDGRLFLVAGGLLGKFYSVTIRRHGGIALDIGSLVDGWTGRKTRPGYGEHLKL